MGANGARKPLTAGLCPLLRYRKALILIVG